MKLDITRMDLPSSVLHNRPAQPQHSLLEEVLSRGDDGRELRLASGAADEEAVDVRHRAQIFAILGIHGAAIQDAHAVRHGAAAEITDHVADLEVRVLCLHGRCDDTCANGPHGLVRNGDLGPVHVLLDRSLQLPGADVHRDARLPFLQRLADGEHHIHARLQTKLHLDSRVLVRLTVQGAALGVSDEHPLRAEVRQLANGDLAGEGTLARLAEVFRADVDGAALDLLHGMGHVQERREEHCVRCIGARATALEGRQQLLGVSDGVH
mmetsp:Transcript_103095/g.330597  ORF Transcript_103095/g.330597 Transcript_103095/m.330597 type:complete len:267 (-) Transcript_103095:288-1088(-)